MGECSRCGGRVEALVAERTVDVAGHSFSAELPASRCVACHDCSFEAAAFERFEVLAASRLADAGLSTGEAFAFMRRALALETEVLATLLTVPPQQLARWERYDFVPRSAIEIVGGLIRAKLEGKAPAKPDPRTALDILMSYRSPRPLAKAVWLDLSVVPVAS